MAHDPEKCDAVGPRDKAFVAQIRRKTKESARSHESEIISQPPGRNFCCAKPYLTANRRTETSDD
jgi:hypothetical protein